MKPHTRVRVTGDAADEIVACVEAYIPVHDFIRLPGIVESMGQRIQKLSPDLNEQHAESLGQHTMRRLLICAGVEGVAVLRSTSGKLFTLIKADGHWCETDTFMASRGQERQERIVESLD